MPPLLERQQLAGWRDFAFREQSQRDRAPALKRPRMAATSRPLRSTGIASTVGKTQFSALQIVIFLSHQEDDEAVAAGLD